MLSFLEKYPHKVWVPLVQHLQITVLTLALSFALAFVLSLVILRSRLLSQVLVGFFSGIYAIPSFALFALLIPLLGLGSRTAIVVLVLYNQFILIRNMLAGFRSVNPAVVEAANGMGMSAGQLFFRVRLPLAAPMILAGVRIAAVSTIGIATIAATINAGGLGVLLFDGMRTRNTVKILWGVLLSSSLAVLANFGVALVEKATAKRTGETEASQAAPK